MKKKLQITPLSDKRSGTYMFALCFIFYFLVYLGRLNYSAALAEITTTGFMEKDAAGLLSTAFFVTYGCGQLISGIISDKLPPFMLVAFGVALAGFANVALYFAFVAELGLAVYIAVWALNGLVQSIVWPTMIRIVSNVLPAEIQTTAGVGMLATTAVGTVLSYILSAAVMKLAGWRECFLVPGIILVASAFLWLVATRPIAAKTISYVEHTEIPDKTATKSAKKSGALIPLMLASGAFVMLVPIVCYSVIKDGITTWAPTIITELFSTEPYISTLMTTVIPLISIFGAALSRIILPVCKNNELIATAAMFTLSLVSLALMLSVGQASLVLMLILLAIIITATLGINALLISLVPLRFGRYGYAATMTGVLNSTAAVSCGISTYLVGLLAKAQGWTLVFIIFAALSALGLVISLAVAGRWMRFKHK